LGLQMVGPCFFLGELLLEGFALVFKVFDHFFEFGFKFFFFCTVGLLELLEVEVFLFKLNLHLGFQIR
jgi:hypothetical protein